MGFNLRTVLLASALLSTSAHAAETNKPNIRAYVEEANWQVFWADEFPSEQAPQLNSKFDSLKECLSERAGRSQDGFSCYGNVDPIYGSALSRAAMKISEAENLGFFAVVDAIMRSILTGQPEKIAEMEVHGGLAIYENWEILSYRVPRTTFSNFESGLGIETQFPEITMEVVERRIPLPETFQPFVRFRRADGTAK